MSLPDVDFDASTCLVTGGTSGIGLAIAEELIARGARRMVLVARNEKSLASTAASLKEKTPGLDVRTIQADLSEGDGPAKVHDQIKEWDWTVDILVNNAGFGRKYVFAQDPEKDTSMANVGVLVAAVVDSSLRFLPEMVKRGRGGILNVGSTGGYQPVPFTASYAAGKAFVMTFSQGIRQEQLTMKTGVRIACIVPGVTETNLDGEGRGETRGPISKVGIDQPSDVAKVAVDAYEENAAAKIVGWNNYIFHAMQGVLPASTIAAGVAAARGKPGEERQEDKGFRG